MLKNKVFKLGTLFSGIGAPEFALDKLNINYESNFACEIDSFARLSFKANHKIDDEVFYQDIYSIDTNNLRKDTDLLVAGFPCFVAGHKISLENGKVKNIEDIEIGDLVLTHKNRYKKVVIPMKKISNHIFKIKTLGVDKILEVTAEHPFYVINKEDPIESEPYWVDVKYLDQNRHWLLKHNTLKMGYTLSELSNQDIMEESIRNLNKISKCGLYELIEIESIDLEYKEIEVYNFEVEDDNSYVVENIIVHNCQAFSSSGRQLGTNCPTGRGILYLEMMRIIESNLPKVILLENVKGITFDKHRELREDLYNRLNKLGYHFKETILNTYKVTGIPQSRNRWFLVGFLNKNQCDNFEFPSEDAELLNIKDFLEMNKENLPNSCFDAPFRYLQNFYANLEDQSDGSISAFTVAREYKGFKVISPTLMASEMKAPKCVKMDSFENIIKTYNEVGFDYIGYKNYIEKNVCSNIRKFKNKDFDLNIAIQFGFDYDKLKHFYRKILVTESLALQSFPNDFIFVTSNAQVIKQSGNSMTVNVMKLIIENILKVYN